MRNGRVENEGDVEVGGFPPYPISSRAIAPSRKDCENLLVPVCVSATHIAYGSIRMEPVFMILGQTAATAAALAIEANLPVQGVAYEKLRARLIADKQVLEWTAPPRKSAFAPLAGIVVDDAQAIRQGEWQASTVANHARVGASYVHDRNIEKGKLSLTFIPDLKPGEYEIRLIYPANPNRSTAVPVTIETRDPSGGLRRHARVVNQRTTNPEGYASLGRFQLPGGTNTAVIVSNAGPDGFVVADGVQFLPIR